MLSQIADIGAQPRLRRLAAEIVGDIDDGGGGQWMIMRAPTPHGNRLTGRTMAADMRGQRQKGRR